MLLTVILDIVECMIGGALGAYLVGSLIPVKKKYRGYEKAVMLGMVFQYAAFYLLIRYFQPLRMFIYGDSMAAGSSRPSIIFILASMLLTMLYSFHFYAGRKGHCGYLVLTFYTMKELTMFLLHPLFSWIIRLVGGVFSEMVEAGNKFALVHFKGILTTMQIAWNFSFQLFYLFLLYKSIRLMKKNLSFGGKRLTPMQEFFLGTQSLIGFCYCIMIRSLLLMVKDGQTVLLIEEYPETTILIPLISGFCLCSVVLSATLLKKLLESSEKEILVETYQNRIDDMEEHMKDVEHLYDGIRGMRHDMKNYVADLEILLRQPGSCQEEIRRYLDGLCSAMEELEMKCTTGNPVTDVVISRKMRLADQNGIPFECSFFYPEGLGISAFDISIILNNGLDNALEACNREKKDGKELLICLDSYVRENMFFIEIKNSFTGLLTPDASGEFLCTSKEEQEGHGLGLKNIKNCAAKYYGRVEWSVRENEFLLTVMLQGSN